MTRAKSASGVCRYKRSAIRLASDAIGVPSPPKSTPSNSGCQSPANGASSTAAGTLLMTWLIAALARNGAVSIIEAKACAIGGMDAMFPENTKKQTNVARRP